MAKAMWNGAVIAEGTDVQIVEGNVYFPASAVKQEFLRPTQTHSVCSWKGDCSYFDVVVGGKVNGDAAWVYKDPKSAADNIRGHIAFWRGVEVQR